MKIPESIISKYQLVPSGEQTGQSFMQNLLLYKSGLPGFEDVVFMECDLQGKPCKDITFYNRLARRDGALTPEFLSDAPTILVLKMVN